jgi:hypothetical protein
MKLKDAFLFSFNLTVMLLLVSCQSETEPTITTSTIVTATNTVMSQPTLELTMTSSSPPTATVTVMVETTSDSVPDSTASATTVSETLTLAPMLATPTIVMPTLTPLPTLEGEELETRVAELLENPMNCDVPCWWGAIPGVTSINEIKHAISPYNFDIYEYYDEEGRVYFRLGIGHVEERNDFEVRIVYGFSDSVLAGVTAYSPSVSKFLAKYGEPDEVWLETMSHEREGDLPVRLNLVYLQKGIAVGYVVDGEINNEVVMACFADKETGRLRLLAPNTTTSYGDFSPIFEVDRRYISLGEATGLTMEEFMQRFNDPTQPQCIETPAKLWN